MVRATFLLALCALLLAGSLRAAPTTAKQIFVIVHGAAAGGWEWERTGTLPTSDGHAVYRVTLAGSGERFHLNSAGVDLQTNTSDAVNTILYEDPRGVAPLVAGSVNDRNSTVAAP